MIQGNLIFLLIIYVASLFLISWLVSRRQQSEDFLIAGAISLLLSWPMIYVISGGRNPNRFIGSIITSTLGLIGALVFLGLEPTAAIVIILFGPIGLLYSGWKIKKAGNCIPS